MFDVILVGYMKHKFHVNDGAPGEVRDKLHLQGSVCSGTH